MNLLTKEKLQILVVKDKNNLAIPDNMLPDLTDDEVDYLAMYLNPRYENPLFKQIYIRLLDDL